jgi:PAS domain-containing protein
MFKTNIETPDWLLQMESILEELNEGVVIVDNQLRVVFANEALIRLGQYERGEMRGSTPDALFPPEDIPNIMRQHESGHRYGRHSSTWPLGEDWDEHRLESALFGGPPRARPAVLPMPDFADLHQQRRSHPHVTQQLLWEEYRQANPDGYRYSRYVAAKNMLRI